MYNNNNNKNMSKGLCNTLPADELTFRNENELKALLTSVQQLQRVTLKLIRVFEVRFIEYKCCLTGESSGIDYNAG